MLLIWLHGMLLARENPVKHIYEDLVEAGFQPLAGKLLETTLHCPLPGCSAVQRHLLLLLGRCNCGRAGGQPSFLGLCPPGGGVWGDIP